MDLYGFTTFNAVRYFENIPVKDTTMEKNDAPDIYYIMYKDIIVFDHFNNTMELIALEQDMQKEGEDVQNLHSVQLPSSMPCSRP